MPDLNQLRAAILKGDLKAAVAVTQTALAENVDPMELVTQYMIPAMDEAGRLFECQEYFVPELLIAARAMKGALGLIRPLLTERGAPSQGRVVIGTVRGDLHDIGKNLVASMLEGAGFDVYDLGTDVSPQKFISEAKAKDAGIVALSALLTTTMTSMKTTIEEFKKEGVRDKFKIIIGGAPVTQEYADQIGADGYSENAHGAVGLARKLAAS